MSSFIEKCLLGEVLPDDIDDHVERWHHSGSRCALHAFLGMTRAEYDLWLLDPDILSHIIEARRRGVDVAVVMAQAQARPPAARAS